MSSTIRTSTSTYLSCGREFPLPKTSSSHSGKFFSRRSLRRGWCDWYFGKPRTIMSSTADLDRIKPLDDLEGLDAPEIIDELAQIVRRQLELLGEDPERPGLVKTPERVALSLAWLTRGYEQDARKVIGDALFEESHENMVMVRDIELYSL